MSARGIAGFRGGKIQPKSPDYLIQRRLATPEGHELVSQALIIICEWTFEVTTQIEKGNKQREAARSNFSDGDFFTEAILKSVSFSHEKKKCAVVSYLFSR